MILNPGDRVGGRFQVEALLGEGGTARVYRVRHLALGSQHALKLLDPEARVSPERLLLEGRIQATLRHPCVVPVTDVVEQGGNPGLVMEFVPGPSLADVLARRRLGVEEALAVFARILAGVGAAHAAGVLHRDLKPHNVLMAPMTGGWLPKVADFGIARSEMPAPDARRTRVGVGIGTPGYMAPEQARGVANVDRRADIYALGVVLYELLTGDLPGGESPGAPPPDPEAARERLGGGAIGDAVSRALQPDPAARFDDIRAMATVLYADRRDLYAVAIGEAAPAPVLIEGEPSETPAVPNPSIPITGPGASQTMVAASFGGTLGGNETIGVGSTVVPPAPAPRSSSALPLASAAVAVVLLLVGGGAGLWWWSTRDAPPIAPDVVAPDAVAPDMVAPAVDAPAAPPAAPTATLAPGASTPTQEGLVVPPPTPPASGPAASPAPSTVVASGAPATAGSPTVASPNGASPNGASPIGAPPTAGSAVAGSPTATSPETTGPTGSPAPPDPAAAAVVASAEPVAAAPAVASPPGAAAPPDVRGTWHGTVGGRAVEVRISSQAGTKVSAQVTLTVGATDRAFRYVGTVDGAGALSLMEDGGAGRLTGTVAGGRLVGMLATGSGKPLSMTVTRE